MTNEELTVLLLDTLGWSYDDIANPGHYKNTADVLLGDLIYAIFKEGTTTKAAENLEISYKVVLTATTRFFVPLFGNLNGGGETWKWKFLAYLGLQYCSSCHKLLELESFDKNSSMSTGRHKYCKVCRKDRNALQYQKEATKEAHKRSYTKHKSDILARNIKYKGERSLRAVSWADQEKIKEIYRNCPEGMHVDHIIPLKGELVSGLHVAENLQYLSPEENMKKGNRFEV